MSINAVTFQYFRLPGGVEVLGRVHLLEPDRVTQKVNEKGNTKRRSALSLEDLEAEADQRSAGDLYRQALELFRPLFNYTQTTRSSLRLAANFGDRSGAVLNIIPTQAAHDRLPFQLFTNRAAQLLGIGAEGLVKAPPKGSERWQYQPSTELWWHGHAGTFQSVADLIRLKHAKRRSAASR